MDNLQEIKDLWQNHKPGAEFINNSNLLGSILKKIHKTEKKVFRLNIMKTITVSILISSIVWLFYRIDIGTLFSWLGVGCIVISSMVMMILYWKIQFKSSSLNHNLPQDEFVRDTISQMKNHKKKFIKLFRWFVVFMIIGINLFYIDLLMDMEYAYRLSFHFGMTFFLIIVFFLGLKIRERKFMKDFQPLIDELKSV